jgi:hypothetical protein
MTNRCRSLSVEALSASSTRGESITRISPRNWTEVVLDFGRGYREVELRYAIPTYDAEKVTGACVVIAVTTGIHWGGFRPRRYHFSRLFLIPHRFPDPRFG